MALATASMTLLLWACAADEHVMEFDSRFSFNVIRVPAWYPPEDMVMTPSETEVLERRGPPDFVRFRWNDDGTFVTSSDFMGKGDGLDDYFASAKRTWVFLSAKTEVEFTERGGTIDHPLTDKLRLVCSYGDPTEKVPPKVDRRGRTKETWIWMDRGRLIKFVDNVVVAEQRFSPTGAGTIER